MVDEKNFKGKRGEDEKFLHPACKHKLAVPRTSHARILGRERGLNKITIFLFRGRISPAGQVKLGVFSTIYAVTCAGLFIYESQVGFLTTFNVIWKFFLC